MEDPWGLKGVISRERPQKTTTLYLFLLCPLGVECGLQLLLFPAVHLDDLLTLGVGEDALLVKVVHQVRLEVVNGLLLLLYARHLKERGGGDYTCI